MAAADFFALRNQLSATASTSTDAAAMYRAYETDLYRFDQLYRHFCERQIRPRPRAGTS